MAMLVAKDGMLCILNSYDEKDVIKKMGAAWVKETRMWVMPLTTLNVKLAMSKLKFPIVEASLDEEMDRRKKKEGRLKAIAAASTTNAPVRLMIPNIKLPLLNYQKLGVMYAMANDDGMLLGDQMGLGKTPQAIATAVHRKNSIGAKSCLIIVPASLKWNWPIEIDKFSDENYIVIDGPPKHRVSQWLGKLVTKSIGHGKYEECYASDVGKPFFYIVNYELLLEDLFGGRKFKINDGDDAKAVERKLKMAGKAKVRATTLESVKDKTWDCIIIDEAHAIKSHSSARTKNVKKMKGNFRMALTGTPMDGRLEELHSIMEFVKPGLFPSKSRFMSKHAVLDWFGKVKEYRHVSLVRDKIRPYFLRRLKKQVLKDLPDKTYQNRIITLSAKEEKLYKEIADREHPATEESLAIVKVIRCKQFCDHPELIGEDDCGSSKMDDFKDIITELILKNGEKVIVFTQYKTMLDIIDREMKALGMKVLRIDGDTKKTLRATYQAQFSDDPTIDAVIGTEAMSQGLNLQAASYVVNYDDNWAPAIMRQREDRAHRHGQRNAVIVINFICKDTIEENIRELLVGKEEFTDEVLGDNADVATLRRLNALEVAKLL